jgi:hypothetical protein
MKACILCKEIKPLDQYYAHPKMADGRLGRCKECHKSEIQKNWEKRMKEPEFRERELDRQRLKERRRRALGIAKKNCKKASKKWSSNNRKKKNAHLKVKRAIEKGNLLRMPCEICGIAAQAHHDDYSKPLDVRWLCVKHHNEHHVEMRRLERLTNDLINNQPTDKP